MPSHPIDHNRTLPWLWAVLASLRWCSVAPGGQLLQGSACHKVHMQRKTPKGFWPKVSAGCHSPLPS